MSEQAVQDWIRKAVASNDVVVFMKGTKNFPQCGFSAQVAQILGHMGVEYKDINVLEDMGVRDGHQDLLAMADHPPSLRQGRVRGRLRHRPRDVPTRANCSSSSTTRASPTTGPSMTA